MNKEKERFEMLLEEIRDKVQFIAEGHGLLGSKIDSWGAKVSGLEAKIDRNEQSIARNGKKIDAVHRSLKNEINVTFLALNDKLDDHIKQPAHS
ncbi:MAG: hypothetical protein ABIE84_04130 [bacterium]